MSKRIQVKTKSGEVLSILVERQQYGAYTFPFVAVLNDWDEGCTYSNGKSPSDAVRELLDQLDEEAVDDYRYLDVFFVESTPMLLRRQAG